MSVTFDKTNISVSMMTDGMDVVCTGVVHVFGRKIEFKVQDLSLIFEFRTDKELSPSQDIQQEIVSEKTLKLTLINFDNPIGTGVSTPIQVGTMNERKYFIAFSAFALGDSDSRRLEYTFMLGEHVKND